MKRQPSGTRDNLLTPYRRALVNKKAELLVALGINGKRPLPERESEADQVVVSHEESVWLCLNRVLYGELHQVEDALGRLALGQYGICAGCGSLIPWNGFGQCPGPNTALIAR